MSERIGVGVSEYCSNRDGEQSAMGSAETAERTDRIMVMTREERKSLLTRVNNWTYIVLSISLSTVVLVIVLGT